jgi:hypothetical protein
MSGGGDPVGLPIAVTHFEPDGAALDPPTIRECPLEVGNAAGRCRR